MRIRRVYGTYMTRIWYVYDAYTYMMRMQCVYAVQIRCGYAVLIRDADGERFIIIVRVYALEQDNV